MMRVLAMSDDEIDLALIRLYTLADSVRTVETKVLRRELDFFRDQLSSSLNLARLSEEKPSQTEPEAT